MQCITICNVPIDAVSRTEALERCRGFLHDGKQHQITTVNPEFIVEAQRNSVFRKALQKSDLALADGMGIVLAVRYLHRLKLERIPGVDFVIDLCGLAVEEGASVFFLGGSGGVAQKTAEVLQSQFPGLRVSGWSEDLDISTSRHLDISVLFVALGAPKQELWIAENLAKLPKVKIAIGVGGAFDLISGKIKRAPQWLRRLGLEWIWRLLQEPWRLTRIYRAAITFPLLLLTKRRKAIRISKL